MSLGRIARKSPNIPEKVSKQLFIKLRTIKDVINKNFNGLLKKL